MNTFLTLLIVFNLAMHIQKICPVPFLLTVISLYLTFPVLGTEGAFSSGLMTESILGYAASNVSAPN